METLASWIWNPLLSFLYLEIALLVLVLTGFVAWRRLVPALRHWWSQRTPDAAQAGTQAPVQHISQGKALLTALGAAVGVGNLAGVSTALHLGGPGALFWLWLSALMGMSLRMSSTWLAIRYQSSDPAHRAYATPMAYLEHFFTGRWRWIPITMAALLLVQGFLTANLIQSNSVAHAIDGEIGASHFLVATLMALAVGGVIMGGLQKIVTVSLYLTPVMLFAYVAAGLFILLSHPLRTLEMIELVFTHAFSPTPIIGGVAGYTVLQAVQFGTARGIFSHGSGLGLAPFIQAANSGDIRHNAFLAALIPVLDTLVICTITGLVVLSAGHWSEWNGAYLTVHSFQASYGENGRIFIIICLTFFAFSTMIGWSHYAERCFHYLGGVNTLRFRWVFVITTFYGPFFPVKLVWSLADVLIGMTLLLHGLSLLYLVIKHQEQMRQSLDGDYSRGS
ncbi:MAG: sodium:alanine symporter family protein [Gammaproteobacteria bacterium]|nr:sodium:alanine symporter family protein [Gammaproteobacteria bacterium]